MIINITITNDKKIISLVDSELINKKFSEEEKELDLTKKFYQGKEIKNMNELIKEFDNATSAIFVGKKATNFATEQLMCEEKNIHTIKNIPYTHIFFF